MPSRLAGHHAAIGLPPAVTRWLPDTFDAADIDAFTVKLDGTDARVKRKSGNAGSLKDVDGDGGLDLSLQIEDADGACEEVDAIGRMMDSTYVGHEIQG